MADAKGNVSVVMVSSPPTKIPGTKLTSLERRVQRANRENAARDMY